MVRKPRAANGIRCFRDEGTLILESIGLRKSSTGVGCGTQVIGRCFRLPAEWLGIALLTCATVVMLGISQMHRTFQNVPTRFAHRNSET